MKWLLQNFGERMRFLLRNPRYALGSLYRELTLADERSLTAVTGVSSRRIRAFLSEPIHTPDFAVRLDRAGIAEIPIESPDRRFARFVAPTSSKAGHD